ncbi:hypothetical protein ACP70R_001963 [Stipagrostis hirtigluma subsp. patula]
MLATPTPGSLMTEKMYGWYGRGAPSPIPFKIFCRAAGGRCLTVRDGRVVLALPSLADEHQQWFKDLRFSRLAKDEEGNPSFALVNKATGLAIRHYLGHGHQVRLAKLVPDFLDESVLWTESRDVCWESGRIRTLHDTRLNLEASPDSSTVVLSELASCETQLWTMVRSDAGQDRPASHPLTPIQYMSRRIHCKAKEGYSVAVRDGAVCFAPTDPNDIQQQWIVDERPGWLIKDADAYPAFALVSRLTGMAIGWSAGEPKPTLKPYNPNYLDKTVLWATSPDMGDGFRCIHLLDSLPLSFGILEGDGDQSGMVSSSSSVGLSLWTAEDRRDNRMWKIEHWDCPN